MARRGVNADPTEYQLSNQSSVFSYGLSSNPSTLTKPRDRLCRYVYERLLTEECKYAYNLTSADHRTVWENVGR
ncbi:hypothetical protein GE061_017685 [Apolygus lucorum]|uniref:Uncharacterized protein n=1 Tax=Apolygus lucorum TaxID=248454 RepID=A0A8S9XBQ4_APOLU|nr:hypothetical protein GE061_017685 [Apolygus lucorum]